MKILCIMKLFTILMLFFVLGANARGFSQNQRVTLDLQGCNVQTLFKEIRKQTGLSFVFNKRHITGLPSISVKARGQQVAEVLDDVFAGTSLECR